MTHAERWAIHWHGSQVRKYTGEPYIEHCREIVEILKGVPHTEDMLAAAWLHDVLEDTECSLMEMHVAFGDDIAFMVLMLTDCDKCLGNRATGRHGRASIENVWVGLAPRCRLSSWPT